MSIAHSLCDIDRVLQLVCKLQVLPMYKFITMGNPYHGERGKDFRFIMSDSVNL